MRREVPLIICFIAGSFMIVDFFVPQQIITNLAQDIRQWTIIVIAAAYVLGVANIVRINYEKISRKEKDWGYKIVLMIGLSVMMLLGIIWGIEEGSTFQYIFNNLYVPMQATMFSLLAFYIASAAFRAFRIRTWEASLLALTAVIVMIGRVPLGSFLIPPLPGLTEWIMDVPNMAAKRGILMGAALGAISTGLKMILGMERSYLGGD